MCSLSIKKVFPLVMSRGQYLSSVGVYQQHLHTRKVSQLTETNNYQLDMFLINETTPPILNCIQVCSSAGLLETKFNSLM